jgi:hypothetical protein
MFETSNFLEELHVRIHYSLQKFEFLHMENRLKVIWLWANELIDKQQTCHDEPWLRDLNSAETAL